MPAAPDPACTRVDTNGISQVFRRSFPCLCYAPRPRPNRHDLANFVGHVGAAPAGWTAKASAISDFGANTQLQHPLPYASRMSLPHTCKARFRLAGSASTGWESNPLDRYERFQLVFTVILLSCSPDATAFPLRSNTGYEIRFSLALPATSAAPSATAPTDGATAEPLPPS